MPDFEVKWSNFQEALKRYEFLQHFKNILVSGKEGMKKPSADIYELCLNRFNIDRTKAIFIDDSARNVKGSEAVGLKAIRFTSPEQLRADLKTLNIYGIMLVKRKKELTPKRPLNIC